MTLKPLTVFHSLLATGVFSVALLVFAVSCGSSSASDASGTEPTPTATASGGATLPPGTGTATSAPGTGSSTPGPFWVAGQRPLLTRFAPCTVSAKDPDCENGLKKGTQVDLVRSAGVAFTSTLTGLAMLDATTLLAFVDPGSSGEKIVTIDILTGKIKNASFIASDKYSTINNISIVGLESLDNIIYIAKSDGVQKVGVSNSGSPGSSLSALAGFASAPCAVDQISGLLKIRNGKSGTNYLAVFSSGSVQKINVLGSLNSNPECIGSGDYASLGSGLAAVGGAQLSDGKLYVLLSGAASSKVVSFDLGFDTTNKALTLTSLSTVFAQTSDHFGVSPKAFGKLTNASVFFGNATDGKISSLKTPLHSASAPDDLLSPSVFLEGIRAALLEP